MDEYDPVTRLTRDLADAARTLGRDEARFLVDNYYQMQANRIRAQGQMRALSASGEPHAVLHWLFDQSKCLEGQVKRALAKYVDDHPVGGWLLETRGVGPVIAAGLLAHVDIAKAASASSIWRYAGLDPTTTWAKGQKRPWNAALKTLCWKLGESFVKVSGREDAAYGRVYVDRKAYEVARNEAGTNAELATKILSARKISKATDAYRWLSAGKLPPAHLHARAKRYAVKMFLAHMFEVWYELHWQKPAPDPWAVAHGGHVHVIPRYH